MGEAVPESALDIAAAVKGGTLTAMAAAEASLARIGARDGKINAFTEVTRERALREAAGIDARRAAGEALPPLAGVPYAVKNLFDIEGITTLAGSKKIGRASCRERVCLAV